MVLPARDSDIACFIRTMTAAAPSPEDRRRAVTALDELADTCHYRDVDGTWRGPVDEGVVLSLFAAAYRSTALAAVQRMATSSGLDLDDIIERAARRTIARIRAGYQGGGAAPAVHSPGLMAAAARYACLDLLRRAHRETTLEHCDDTPSGEDPEAALDMQMRLRWIRRQLTETQYTDLRRLVMGSGLNAAERQRKSRLTSRLRHAAAVALQL